MAHKNLLWTYIDLTKSGPGFDDILTLRSSSNATDYSITKTQKGYRLEIMYHSTKQIEVEPTRYNKSLTSLLRFAQKHSEEKIYDN